MKTVDDIKQSKFHVKMMNVGNTGSGKTYLAGTFPKTYFLSCEPGGMDTILVNPNLRANLVGWENLVPNSVEGTKETFGGLAKALEEARALAKEGKVDTLVLDNMTYLSKDRWSYIETYQPEISPRTGKPDLMAMYGKLRKWLNEFTKFQLLTFPGNVVMNIHEQLESDEALEKKPDKSSPIVPNILGGFRDDAPGMFSCVFYLIKKYDKDKKMYKYYARTNSGNSRNAKNRYNLPTLVEDVSYAKIMEVINKSLNKEV